MTTNLKSISENKFMFLLLAFVALLLVVPFLQVEVTGGWGIQAIYMAILLSAIYSLRRHKKHFLFSAIFATLGCILNFINLITGNILYELIGNLFYALFYLLFIQVILNDIMKAEVVSADTFCGAICAYFMLGVFFTSLYTVVEYFIPGSFSNLNAIDGRIKSFNMLYFSFMTLTTVGYGDILPVSDHAKAFVMLEGVTGVFYIAILVSHLVTGVSKIKEKL